MFFGEAHAGAQHVGEHGARPDEDVAPELEALIEADVVLDAAAVADADAGCDEATLAQHAILSDHGLGHDVAMAPDLGALTDDRAGFHLCRRMNEHAGRLQATGCRLQGISRLQATGFAR